MNMNTTLAAFIGAVLGGTGTLLGTMVTGWMTGRRERTARNYEAKAKMYAALLEHLDELNVSQKAGSPTMSAFAKDPEKFGRHKTFVPWYFDLQVQAPMAVQRTVNQLIELITDVGNKRTLTLLATGLDPYTVWDEPALVAVVKEYSKTHQKLLDLIRADLGA
ncbi:hypothetical protein [Amycolatopsis sp. DSM 110486]|uniref:hypothetical protein n=1 Tax=Amycolatopsis sp. DSM 110486 TaxID=2865832 RepID=UPI001C696D44|nr:hypothetical protein [Amycolatopsis sp. DSM 110486]QYN17533.1 hypothetical protein K1T34_32630 [Amycolatopsis sp. DSM 110486]